MKFRTALAVVILLTTGISFGSEYTAGIQKVSHDPQAEAQALVELGIKQGLIMAEAQCKKQGFFTVVRPNLTMTMILCYPAGTQVDATPAAKIKKVIQF